jgi:type I restriction enzyme, R subunit
VQQVVSNIDELRKTLLKYKLHTDQDLFDRACAYIRQYY